MVTCSLYSLLHVYFFWGTVFDCELYNRNYLAHQYCFCIFCVVLISLHRTFLPYVHSCYAMCTAGLSINICSLLLQLTVKRCQLRNPGLGLFPPSITPCQLHVRSSAISDYSPSKPAAHFPSFFADPTVNTQVSVRERPGRL